MDAIPPDGDNAIISHRGHQWYFTIRHLFELNQHEHVAGLAAGVRICPTHRRQGRLRWPRRREVAIGPTQLATCPTVLSTQFATCPTARANHHATASFHYATASIRPATLSLRPATVRRRTQSGPQRRATVAANSRRHQRGSGLNGPLVDQSTKPHQ